VVEAGWFPAATPAEGDVGAAALAYVRNAEDPTEAERRLSLRKAREVDIFLEACEDAKGLAGKDYAAIVILAIAFTPKVSLHARSRALRSFFQPPLLSRFSYRPSTLLYLQTCTPYQKANSSLMLEPI
jgi:hypothetical protein